MSFFFFKTCIEIIKELILKVIMFKKILITNIINFSILLFS